MIVVHDRFLTGSGTFVDASMLGDNQASSAPAPAAHLHGTFGGLNELQDSSMMVYDEDEDDQEDDAMSENKVAVAAASE